MLKDPSVKFHEMMDTNQYQVFTPNKILANARSKADGKMLLTTSTVRTQNETVSRNKHLSQVFEQPKAVNSGT